MITEKQTTENLNKMLKLVQAQRNDMQIYVNYDLLEANLEEVFLATTLTKFNLMNSTDSLYDLKDDIDLQNSDTDAIQNDYNTIMFDAQQAMHIQDQIAQIGHSVVYDIDSIFEENVQPIDVNEMIAFIRKAL